MAAGAIGVACREWPARHRAAWPRRTCAKSHAGETEARGEERKKTPLGQNWPGAGSCRILHPRCPIPPGARGRVAQWVPPAFPGGPALGTATSTGAGPAGTYLVGWPRRAVALQHPPGQAGAPLGATRVPGAPARGGRCRLQRGRCGGRGAAARARPGSLPNQSLRRCFACALETRSPRSQVCAFGACGASTNSPGTAEAPAGWPGVPPAPSRAAEPHLSCLSDAPIKSPLVSTTTTAVVHHVLSTASP